MQNEYANIRSASKAPWIFSFIVAAGAAAGGYYLIDRTTKAEKALQESKHEIDALGAAAHADLARNRDKIKAEKAALLEKEKEAERMTAELKKALGDASGELSSKDGKLTLQLVDKVLFSLGEANLTENGKRVLSKVGTALNEFPDKQVWVQGHTDNVPISEDNKEFSSNWELSAMRAVNVVQYLQNEVGVDPTRLAAVGFSEYRPVSKRSKRPNRRIEIVLAPGDVSLTK